MVGGERVGSVPWFVDLGGCGGTLVAPDRVLTAGHCVRGSSPTDLARIRIGGVTRSGVRFALHRDWLRQNGGNLLDDVAVIALSAPVPGVARVRLGGAAPARVRVLGRGASKAPRAGRAPGLGDGALRSAVLRLVGDGACARAYRTVRGNGGERFDGARMLCAGDPDGRPPLASACVGDSGGPLYGGSRRAPVLVGIVSFGGDRCGADRLPSVFTQVSRYRSFIAAATPVWAPWASAPATISHSGSGGYSCVVPRWAVVPDRVDVTWERLRAGGPLRVATGQTYVPGPADRGHVLACSIVASNAGGVSTAPAGAVSSVRIEG